MPVEVVNFTPPELNAKQIDALVATSPDVASKLGELASTKLSLPRLSLVVRTDPEPQLDDIYNMADAQIVTPQEPAGTEGAVAVTILYKKVDLKRGLTGNPGPPPDAPAVQPSGSNLGWVHGLSSASEGGRQVKVLDFTAPYFDGRLTVRFDEPASELHQLLLQSRPSADSLILVLPDRARRRYVEFKPWDPRTTALDGEGDRGVAFDADTIECLTRADNSS